MAELICCGILVIALVAFWLSSKLANVDSRWRLARPAGSKYGLGRERELELEFLESE